MGVQYIVYDEPQTTIGVQSLINHHYYIFFARFMFVHNTTRRMVIVSIFFCVVKVNFEKLIELTLKTLYENSMIVILHFFSFSILN